jgi:hypothetical protein
VIFNAALEETKIPGDSDSWNIFISDTIHIARTPVEQAKPSNEKDR